MIWINGKIMNKNLKIKKKDEIIIKIKKEKLNWIIPQKIPLDIIYEDKNILIINKDAWINVHPIPWIDGIKWTLVNAILYYCKKSLPCINGVERPWIVHRLDKNTSGIILIAKTDFMMQYLSNVFKSRKIEKYYLAIVYWKIKSPFKYPCKGSASRVRRRVTWAHLN